LDWKNQRFLDDMRSDVKRGLTFIVEKGYWPGGNPPVGYRAAKEVIGRKHNGDQRLAGRLVKDESVSDRVALAWKMKLRDNASYLQIHEVTHLYSDPKHYADFFSNLLYTGIFVYHGKRFPAEWEQGATFCEPYITLQEYLTVQQGRQKRHPAVVSPRIMASSYLLTGLVYCGLCSTEQQPVRLTGQTDPRKRGTQVYRCSTKIRSRGHDCQLPRIPCWRLEEVVIGLLKAHVLTSEYVNAEVDRANALLAEQHDEVSTTLPEAERLVKAAQKKVESIVELIGKKGVTPILEKQYDEANHYWLEATARVNLIKSSATTMQRHSLTYQEAQAILDEMLLTMDEGTIKERQSLISQFVERIEVFPDHADVYFRFRPEGERIGLGEDWQEAFAINNQDSPYVRSPGQVFSGCPHGGSNAGLWLRRPSLCPLSYRGKTGFTAT
jgi:site-specific DNA recombinase